MVIYTFLLEFFQSFSSKKVIRVLSIRDNLILLITYKNHKAHLLSCAQRCSSKLQEIQNLENFVSMTIQGTQVPMYTKHTLFLYFSDFSIFFNFYIKKINNIEKKQQKHVKQNNKTRLTQNKKQKEREDVIESRGALFLPHLGRTFPLSKPLNLW